MPKLCLLESKVSSNPSSGELLCCSYSPDGNLVLAGGWDGVLRLVEAGTGVEITNLHTGSKAVTACAIVAGGKKWLTGSSDGLLACWDAMSHRQLSIFLAHPRPISAIALHRDGPLAATASWDRSIILWSSLVERVGRHLRGHHDIVAGCSFINGADQLLSWSYDNSLRIWDTALARPIITLTGHVDRVTAASVSIDGRLALSGARDGGLHLWDLRNQRGIRTGKVNAEVCGCFFLPDNTSAVVVDGCGRVTLHDLNNLRIETELATNLPVRCAQLSPGGNQLALACANGLVGFIALDGIEMVPLEATAKPVRHNVSLLNRLFRRGRQALAYTSVCPVCHHAFEFSALAINQPAPCPSCLRQLRFSMVN